MISKKGKATKPRVRMPFSLGQLAFEPEEVQQRTARELYVELTAGLAIQPPGPDEGLTCETLLTLYGLFRAISALAAPAVADGDPAAACRFAAVIGGET